MSLTLTASKETLSNIIDNIDHQIDIYLIDLFCGFGGVTEGYTRSERVKVIACVNHDEKAIKCHKKNFPNVLHFTEDIRTLDISPIVQLVKKLRMENPSCIIILWGSVDCTNHSIAKGGKSRDADSRTLPLDMLRYIDGIDPDYVEIENVKEFLSWGPMIPRLSKDKLSCPLNYEKIMVVSYRNGEPVINKKGVPKMEAKRNALGELVYSIGPVLVPESRTKGRDYMRWKADIETRGYRYEHRMMNAADYGGYTSRDRLFIQFAKGDLPIVWPKPTHSKKPGKTMFDELLPWKPVKEVLDLEDKGISIFNREKPLVTKSIERIFHGCLKQIAGTTEKSFIAQYYSGNVAYTSLSVNQPLGTITTKDVHALINTEFMVKYHGSGDNSFPVTRPCTTLTTKDRVAKVNLQYLDKQYGGKYNHQSMDNPAGTLTVNPKMALISAEQDQFINMNYTTGQKNKSINEPAGAITTVPKHNLVSVEKTPFILNTNFYNNGHGIDSPCPTSMASRRHHYLINLQSYKSKGTAIEQPAPTLLASKRYEYLITADAPQEEQEYIHPNWIIQESDCENMKKLRVFMSIYGIIDIKMRMLKVRELLPIQGFPVTYHMIGTETDQKKFIGNSVHPNIPEAMGKCTHIALIKYFKNKLAA
jgi:DNA (cytosine-5)-methyltransferase 1